MKIFNFIFAFIFISLFVSCGSKEKKADTPSGAPKGNGSITVDGIIAQEETTSNTITTTGNIIANEEVEIKSEVSGRVVKIYFKEGTPVSKGQMLVKLNDDDLVAQMQRLNIEIKLQEEKEARQKQLLASTAISKEEYDVTKTNLNLLKANVDILKTQLDKTKIVAPFSGIVGLKSISEGAIISPTTVIASIQNINPLKLDFSIPEKYNSLIKNGSSVSFTVVGQASPLKATVFAKEPKIDPVTRTSMVRATFPNPSGNVFPGSFADINIQVGDKTKAIMVPTIAYIPDIAGAKLFVSKGGKAVSVPVTAGIRTEKEIQILTGVNVGDTVLTSGILQLRPNMPIQVNIQNKVI
ncbi:MAG TPA: efflux RND transporter periplasmic adaptor subunit [Saprospiraceae bacterium]|nr:efflux RND transporter periplasmic adaptor subunit [Saprospiraceae bacterium]HMU02649.1 efflux RND transporter periplasmic adaptor subunit [Saprospiraceae bacterium]